MRSMIIGIELDEFTIKRLNKLTGMDIKNEKDAQYAVYKLIITSKLDTVQK